ncbi:hypothetical protein G9A89_013419 [Geosiphon pyriformis]|nr:hypothetical protein G9A89_013419 [Geosiphon pyriformis]
MLQENEHSTSAFPSISSDIQETPIRITWNVFGDLTETLFWPATNITEEKIVLFMIPGNPGAIDYYIPFLSTIYKEYQKRIEIIGVSHLGHTHGPHNNSLKRLWSLQDQIEHKIKCFDLIREKFLVQDGADGGGGGGDGGLPKFILCGHSMGAYICSRLLKARPNHGIDRTYFLFPTLQHIAKTPNGTMLTWLFYERPRNLLSTLIHSLRTLLGPTGFKTLIRFVTYQQEPHLSITADRLLHWHVVQNTLYMSDTEMKDIHELDEDFFRQHIQTCVFYFGKTDNWAPIEHYRDMVARFPDGKIHLCEIGMAHAFVLEHSEIMGRKMFQWIKESL